MQKRKKRPILIDLINHIHEIQAALTYAIYPQRKTECLIRRTRQTDTRRSRGLYRLVVR